MIARQKLDIIGIKLSLRQWSRFTREERGQLADLPCESVAEQAAYHALVAHLIATRSDEPLRHLVTRGLEAWRDAAQMPDAVKTQAQADGIAPYGHAMGGPAAAPALCPGEARPLEA